jgi:hypothetical protein
VDACGCAGWAELKAAQEIQEVVKAEKEVVGGKLKLVGREQAELRSQQEALQKDRADHARQVQVTLPRSWLAFFRDFEATSTAAALPI